LRDWAALRDWTVLREVVDFFVCPNPVRSRAASRSKDKTACRTILELRLAATRLQRSAPATMSDADALEIYCPNCRTFVTPLKAAVSWYCPRCAWQFSDSEIERRRDQQPPADEAACESHAARNNLLPRQS
jgi:hypothetical protein